MSQTDAVTTSDRIPPSPAPVNELGGRVTVAELQKRLRRGGRHRWRRRFGWTFLVLAILIGAARLAAPTFVRWYVNRVIDQSPMYDGQIGDVSIHLWRGAYSIENIKLIKTTGNVPVPLFSAQKVDFSVEWRPLLRHGRLVTRINVDQPEFNFVDAQDKADSETGGGASAPWLGMIDDLAPFKVNSAKLNGGSLHFRTYTGKTPVDVYISTLDAELDDLTNVQNRITPLLTTITATGMAMDQAPFELHVKFDPTSYQPTFTVLLRMIGLDVTKLRDFTRHYGNFDFEHGWFDLVVQLEATEGQLTGYVKPLFRDLSVLGPQDLKEDNPLGVFWEAVVGVTIEAFENMPRDQLATVIPVTGDLSSPKPDILATLFNVLRNAFIRAYLPTLQGSRVVDGMTFQNGTIIGSPATLPEEKAGADAANKEKEQGAGK